ncbi:MAG TPA: FAD-dependent monooxygenase [Candidatus Koribacter sp.]
MEVAREYDLVVAGGGPAGTAAAITAARVGARVLLLEQGRFPRQKVCGEFVSAESLELLRRLLAEDAAGLAMMERAPRIERARLFLDGGPVEIPVVPSASIPRFAMDEALWRAARVAGVTCCEDVTVEAIRSNDAFEIATSSGTFAATMAIGATGRWSKLRQPVAKRNTKKLLGLKAHYRERNPPASTDLYFFRGGYCGVQPVGEGLINACALVKADVATDLASLFEMNEALAERSRGWELAMDPVSTAPLIFAEPEPTKDGVLFAGDTAGFIDPFAGDGISLALRTGTAAAQVAMHVISGRITVEQAEREYRRRYERQFLPAFRAAAQARALIACPRPVQKLALRFLRFPRVAEMVFARTRAREAA